MPHGDFSDYAAFFCLGTGGGAIFAPQLYFRDFGPIKAFFDSAMTPELSRAVQFAGGLLLFIGLSLSAVRWNTINGKPAGFALLLAALNCAAISWSMDGAIVLRGWHVFAFMLKMAGLHLMFRANPMWTAASLAAKEKAKADKKK